MTLHISFKARYVLGVDAATTTGVVVLREHAGAVTVEYAKALTCKDKPGDTDLGYKLFRAYRLAQLVRSELKPYIFDIGVIEGYGFASQKIACSVEIGTLIRYLLWNEGVPLMEVPIGTLKKWATGKGNTKKDKMRLEVYKKWEFEHDSDDVVDAYAMARYGIQLLKWAEGNKTFWGPRGKPGLLTPQ